MTVTGLMRKLHQLPGSDKIAHVRIEFGDGGIYEHPTKKEVPDICPRCGLANTADHRNGTFHNHYRELLALLPHEKNSEMARKYGLSQQRVREFRRRLSGKIQTAQRKAQRILDKHEFYER